MEPSPSGDGGISEPENRGLWNSPRMPQYSKETQEMLKLMMRESRLTNLQQRHINNHITRGGALPLACSLTSSTPSQRPKVQVAKGAGLPAKPQRRPAEMCRSGDNYTRERFRPSATRDLEEEKMRLQNILAEGKADPIPKKPQRIPHEKGEPEPEPVEEDRFQEVLDEIKDRMEFLEEMSALGRGKVYHNIINTEISQKIRELELINKAHSASTSPQMERNGLGDSNQGNN